MTEHDLRVNTGTDLSQSGIGTETWRKTDTSDIPSETELNKSAPAEIRQVSRQVTQSEDRMILFFTPLIAKFVINSEQCSYMYELQPGNEEDTSLIDQVRHIQAEIPLIATISIHELLEGSYLVLKWIPTNHNAAYKIRSTFYCYYKFHTSEMDSELREIMAHNSQKQKISHMTIQLKRQFSSKISLTSQTRVAPHEVMNLDFYRCMIDKQIVLKRGFDWMTRDNMCCDKYTGQLSQLIVQGEHQTYAVNAQQMYLAHHIYLHQYASVVNYQNLFEFALELLGMSYQNIMMIQLTDELMRTTVPTERLFVNVLYMHYVHTRMQRYFKAPSPEFKTLTINRPFLRDKVNAFFLESAFLSHITQEDIRDAIFEFSNRLVHSLCRPLPQPAASASAIQQSEVLSVLSNTTGSYLTGGVFTAAENMLRFKEFDQFFSACADNCSYFKTAKVLLSTDKIDLSKITPQTAEEVFSKHYDQLVKELFSGRQEKFVAAWPQVPFEVKYHKANTFRQQKENRLKDPLFNTSLCYLPRKPNPEYSKSMFEALLTEDVIHYQKLARRVICQQPVVNQFHVSHVGFQIQDADPFFHVADMELQRNRKNIKTELGQVFGFEGPDIRIQVLTTRDDGIRPKKFSFSAKPKEFE